MEFTKFVNEDHRQILAEARQRYGDLRELSVSAEELCELAIVCNKFCRYETKEKAQQKLHKHVLTELADVLVVLDHILSIFDIQEEELQAEITGKINRLRHWLMSPSGLEVSTVDREIPGQQSFDDPPAKAGCESCEHFKDFRQLQINGACIACMINRIHKDDRPLYKRKATE